jgi:4'-phosphopantetheinyl transferase
MGQTMYSRSLTTNAVHIWHAELDQTEHSADLIQLLSADERYQASRFRNSIHRTRFITRRAFLRHVLSQYCEVPAREITFSYSAYGKPLLRYPTSNLRFSLSHSEHLAACAVTWDREIGLDIEKVRTIPDISDIARMFFSAHEREGLARLPANMRNLAFLNFWTRKEAYLKAVGKGLSVPLTRLDVASLPQASDAVRGTRIEPSQGPLWLMRDIKIADEFISTLVVEGENWTLEVASNYGISVKVDFASAHTSARCHNMGK